MARAPRGPRRSRGILDVTAEPIARVMADVLTRSVRHLPDPDRESGQSRRRKPIAEFAMEQVDDPVVVDATAIYDSCLPAPGEPYNVYEDYPCILPPWNESAICYVNRHGNVHVMHVTTNSYDDSKRELPDPPWPDGDDHTIDWPRVKYMAHVYLYLGGWGNGHAVETTGPLTLWSFALYEDGSPADLHWVKLADAFDPTDDQAPLHVVLAALNFLNCRNVAIVEPKRHRAQARRIERTGVHVHTINVFPPGKQTRGRKGEPIGGTPLTPVRGHFAHYGPQYGRGLLFGKHEGRFYIPQHARGNAEDGESAPDYKLVT
jgi:hypothetical protein